MPPRFRWRCPGRAHDREPAARGCLRHRRAFVFCGRLPTLIRRSLAGHRGRHARSAGLLLPGPHRSETRPARRGRGRFLSGCGPRGGRHRLLADRPVAGADSGMRPAETGASPHQSPGRHAATRPAAERPAVPRRRAGGSRCAPRPPSGGRAGARCRQSVRRRRRAGTRQASVARGATDGGHARARR